METFVLKTFDTLSKESLLNIITRLKSPTIASLCLTNKKHENIIWKKKIIEDFPFIRQEQIYPSFKKYYTIQKISS